MFATSHHFAASKVIQLIIYGTFCIQAHLINSLETSYPHVYVGTDNGLALTSDNGQTWTRWTTQNGLPNNNVMSVFATQTHIYVATTNGIAISADNGATWTTKTTKDGLTSNDTSAIGASGNTIYVGTSNYASGLSVSTNNGQTWTTQNTTTGLPGNFITQIYMQGSTVYVTCKGLWSTGGLAVSTDNGETWRLFTSVLAEPPSNSVFAINNDIFVGTDGGLSASVDNGRTWTTQQLNDSSYTQVIYSTFGSENNIYAVKSYSLVIASIKDLQWTPQYFDFGAQNGVASGTNVYIGTRAHGLMISNDNGQSWQQYAPGSQQILSAFALNT